MIDQSLFELYNRNDIFQLDLNQCEALKTLRNSFIIKFVLQISKCGFGDSMDTAAS